MNAILDRFGVSDLPIEEGDSDPVRDFKTISQLAILKWKLLSDFVRRNTSKKTLLDSKIVLIIFLSLRFFNIEDSEIFNLCAFMKNAIKQIAKVYPNNYNKVNYDSVKVPRHLSFQKDTLMILKK